MQIIEFSLILGLSLSITVLESMRFILSGFSSNTLTAAGLFYKIIDINLVARLRTPPKGCLFSSLILSDKETLVDIFYDIFIILVTLSIFLINSSAEFRTPISTFILF